MDSKMAVEVLMTVLSISVKETGHERNISIGQYIQTHQLLPYCDTMLSFLNSDDL